MLKKKRVFQKGLLFLSFLAGGLLLFVRPAAYAGSLTFTPGEDSIDYGDVYINQMANKPVFNILADGGDCSGDIRPDFDQPTPAGKQTIAPAGFDFAGGDATDVWIGLQSSEPGDHNFYIKITADCGTYYKTIRFHCIGYGYVQGSIIDSKSGAPIPTATVEPGNPYLMETALSGNGNYTARGYPGYHWLIVKAPGYAELMVDIEIQESKTKTFDIQLTPDHAPRSVDMPWIPLLLMD
jgi:hypothetical protein